jgi:glutathione S-transferase
MSEPRIELLGVPQSNFTRAVRITLEEKGVPYDLHPLAPHTPEILAVHPWGKIPVLRKGDFSLCESRAIVGYLDRVYPEVPAIPTNTPEIAAQVDQWISILSTVVDTVLIRRYALSFLFPNGPGGSVDREIIDAVIPEMRKAIQALDIALSGKTALAGDQFTFADALLTTMLEVTVTLPEGRGLMEGALNVTRYLEHHADRPSVAATRPW